MRSSEHSRALRPSHRCGVRIHWPDWVVQRPDAQSRMLSIGKLGAGQAEYYLEQAHVPVTHAGAVGAGIEDYYLAGPEAPGRWLGGGSPLLGLSDTVGEDALRRV